ncbi:hypothetical protein OE88DRAFT_1674000 [Heliocybe sulcata]|uniref:Uncharacterized protein n=1 Tax=Heliocybe sulcata TaxID=5364 RepID=A0A5C3NCN7_9AGAM|nr:hypothetical protein OE88DRAFT_1674000 [Heliocybe sulcata]
MLADRGKHRLYIVLQYRGAGPPGYHIALLLAPKNETAGPDTREAHRFHVTNSFSPGAVIGSDGKPLWRYEHEPVNTIRVENIVARVLIAKLPSSTTLPDCAADISQMLEGVPLVQEDGSWRCHHWAWQAMHSLKVRGGNWSTIPDVVAGGEVEAKMNKAGDEGTKKRFGAGYIPISMPSQIHTIDLRDK